MKWKICQVFVHCHFSAALQLDYLHHNDDEMLIWFLIKQSSPFPVASLDADALPVDNIAETLHTPTPMVVLDSVMVRMMFVKSFSKDCFTV